jgi:integration host factor subunit beta
MTTKTKKDLVQEIAQDQNLHPQIVKTVIQSFLDKMIDTLSKGERLEFRHFGVFEVVSRKAKVGRNPKKADVSIVIPARRAVKFTPGKTMKAIMDGEIVEKKLEEDDSFNGESLALKKVSS